MTHFSTRRAAIAFAFAITAFSFAIRSTEGAKPPKVTPPRPILYFSVNSARTGWAIRRTDEAGTSDIVVNASGVLTYGGRARFSPEGLLIGGYHGQVAGGEGIMVMKADGTNEQVVVTDVEFDAWNLARPGVQSSLFLPTENENCWLGTGAILFPAYTEYDGDLYGGDPETTVGGRALFV